MYRHFFFILISSLLLTARSFPSHPTGPEFPLDTTLSYNSSRYEQSYPAITFDGSNYIVVWQDSRRLYENDIFGTRVAFDGRILDPGGIIISMAPEHQSFPAIASNFLNSMVVWVDERGILDGSGFDLYGTRVTPSGVVLDPIGIFLADGLNNPYFPAVAYGGTNYLMVWQSYDLNPNNIEIYGVRLDLFGQPIDANPFPIPSAPGKQRAPAISFDGTNYLVVWEDNRNGTNFDIYGSRVSPFGMILDTLGIPISIGAGEEFNPAVAFDGLNYLVVWQNDSDTFLLLDDFDIYGKRISTDGTLLDTMAINISSLWIDTLMTQQVLPSISFDGMNYLVTWMDRRIRSNHFDLYGTRVAMDGTVLDTLGIPISTTLDRWSDLKGIELFPTTASNGINHLVVWTAEDSLNDNFSPSRSQIYGKRMDSGGSLLDPFPLDFTLNTPFQEIPVLDFDGNNALVTWGESFDIFYSYNEDSLRVPGIRINPGGMLTDPIPFTIDWNGLYPSISFGGTNFMILSVNDGYLIDTSGTVIGTITGNFDNSWRHAITYDGTNHLLLTYAWNRDTLYARRYDPLGNRIPPTTQIAPHSPWNGARHPTLAFDGTNYLAAWFALSSSTGDTALLAGRITPDAVLLDSSGILISSSVALDYYYSFFRDRETPLSIAYGVNQYLVVWEDIRNDASGENTDLYGARITPDGIVLDTNGIPISRASNHQWNPAVAYDGNNFVVVWEDYRNGIPRIFGTEVTPSGLVLNPGGILISEGDHPNGFPELVKVGEGRSLIVYQSFRPAPYGSYRIYGRLFESSVGVEEDESFPLTQFKLFQNRPNPFMGNTNLSFNLPTSNFVSLKVYDISGRLVKVILEGEKKAGFYSIPWDGKDFGSGVYFYRLIVGAYGDTPLHNQARKMILLK